MNRQIAVNPGQIVINDGSTFLVTAADGDVDDRKAQGLFARDTRLVSYYRLYVNRQRLTLLASSCIDHHSARYVYTNAELNAIGGRLPQNSLLIALRRDIAGGMHEDVDVTNWHREPIDVDLALAIRSDFADLFQVKANDVLTHGDITTQWEDDRLNIDYQSGSFRCGLSITCEREDSPLRNANGRLSFRIKLRPGERWHTCLKYAIRFDEQSIEPQSTCRQSHDTAGGRIKDEFVASATRIKSSNRAVDQAYSQAIQDMGALRLKISFKERNCWMPAAGVPWFMAVFGRDSIIVSLQSLAVHREFAAATLSELAKLQATEVDDWRDAQPGRMPHELRRGELTVLGKRPHSPYYGTVDATPLWIITLAECFRFTGDEAMLRQNLPPLERALHWIDKYGDFDGDGFVEYATRSEDGLKNQGWKDSGDAIVHADGSQATPPIALCEVQGEVYYAWKSAASIYRRLGDDRRAEQIDGKAERLYAAFNDRFWMEDQGYYCLGLDADKRQICSIASNPGQLLWTGIVPTDRAEKVVRRLFAEDLWCGWGIRTLSSSNPAYNPLSYQRGSVWPVDNAIIAAGLKRYGRHAEAARIAEAIFAAADYFQASRLPELYAGDPRTEQSFPIPYVDANSPQGWSSGALLHLIFVLLGISADAENETLYVDPALPDWLDNLTVRNLAIGDAEADLRFWRDDDQTLHEVIRSRGALTVKRLSEQTKRR